jgi:hypothetical protein
MVGSGAMEKDSTPPDHDRWNECFEYLKWDSTIVQSGGDVYTLGAHNFERLLSKQVLAES